MINRAGAFSPLFIPSSDHAWPIGRKGPQAYDNFIALVEKSDFFDQGRVMAAAKRLSMVKWHQNWFNQLLIQRGPSKAIVCNFDEYRIDYHSHLCVSYVYPLGESEMRDGFLT
ncbi:MAG: hypothetical protein MZV70_46390 [Desulfobacterales bacterium]|nr:hypothetical protein [Desulfobacterales bacterium]